MRAHFRGLPVTGPSTGPLTCDVTPVVGHFQLLLLPRALHDPPHRDSRLASNFEVISGPRERTACPIDGPPSSSCQDVGGRHFWPCPPPLWSSPSKGHCFPNPITHEQPWCSSKAPCVGFEVESKYLPFSLSFGRCTDLRHPLKRKPFSLAPLLQACIPLSG